MLITNGYNKNNHTEFLKLNLTNYEVNSFYNEKFHSPLLPDENSVNMCLHITTDDQQSGTSRPRTTEGCFIVEVINDVAF